MTRVYVLGEFWNDANCTVSSDSEATITCYRGQCTSLLHLWNAASDKLCFSNVVYNEFGFIYLCKTNERGRRPAHGFNCSRNWNDQRRKSVKNFCYSSAVESEIELHCLARILRKIATKIGPLSQVDCSPKLWMFKLLSCDGIHRDNDSMFVNYS